jgi:hypothetical protein
MLWAKEQSGRRVGGYWFISHDLTGNHQYMFPLDLTHYIDITGKDGTPRGTIAIYQGTTKLLLHQEAEDADRNEVWEVSSLSFFSKVMKRDEQGGR